MEIDESEWIKGFVHDLQRRGRKPQTIFQYRSKLELALKELGSLDVGANRLKRWIDSYPRFKKESTKENVRRILVVFYDWCIPRYVDPPNPAKTFKFVSSDDGLRPSVTEEEIRRAISVGGKEGCWIALGAYQGLAPRHMAALTREAVDLNMSPGVLNVTGSGSELISPNLHSETLAALEKLPLPGRGRLFSSMNAQEISRAIRDYLYETDIRVSANDLQTWYRSQVELFGKDFGRGFDATVLDPELWEHVRRSFAAADWATVTGEAAKFTEDRIRRWTGLVNAKTGGQLMTAAFGDDGSFRLGPTDADHYGWHHIAMGLTMAVRNPSAHNVQRRPDHRTYAASVLGTCSLLLTQFRHDHVAHTKPARRK
jgi:hypothetical protein